ncbi:MAG TPA: glycosyltransferase, partial [Casimicrobiaceae bacterium]|nr:glycosyltransferase [Casimicrobiaceae bacterium]
TRLNATTIHTTFLQHAPLASRWFRYAAALAPELMHGFDLSDYDVIISDSHAIAKGVRRSPAQLHVCYCHTPARFAWTMAPTYAERVAYGSRFGAFFARRAQARFRTWDLAASKRVDDFVANSQHIAEAIARCYGRSAAVIYPPVDVERFSRAGRGLRGETYVTVSRLVPYKRNDLIVEAFRRMPRRKLTIVGDGPERPRLARDLPSNVTLAGRVDDATIERLLGEARAFVFAACEDFGIAAVEAQAAGTPVIAFGPGGANETIRGLQSPMPTGVLFDQQTPAALIGAIEQFEQASIQSEACRVNAARFAAPRFRAEIKAHLDSLLDERAERPSNCVDDGAFG